jgi:Holliday junction resolvase-like predicted endonuclease
MPAKDRYHDAVKRALLKAGWKVEDEQFTITVGERNLWVDLVASKDNPSLVILVEVKELADVDSAIEALANAIGKFVLYSTALHLVQLSWPLYLAVTIASYNGILSQTIGREVRQKMQIPLIVFDQMREEIVQWIP